MAVDDLIAVRTQFLVQGRVCSFNLAYATDFTEELATVARACDRAFNADVVPEMLLMWSVNVRLQSTYCLRVNPPGAVPSYTYQTSDVGARLGNAMPNDSPYVISLKTNAPNSKFNGRCYVSGYSEDDADTQQLAAAYKAGAAEDFAVAITSNIVDPDLASRIFRPVVLNRMNAGVPISPPLHYDITNWDISGIIYSQRRRRTKMTEVGVP